MDVDISRWIQMNPDVSKHMQMNPSGFRCIQMDPDISRLIYIYIYIYPDESKWTQSIQAMEHAVSVQLQHRASYSYIAYRQIYMHDGISREAYITLRLFNAFLKAVSAMWDIKLSLIRDFLSDIAICCFCSEAKIQSETFEYDCIRRLLHNATLRSNRGPSADHTVG